MRPTVREFFDNYLDDLDTLFLNLEAYFHKRLLPRTAPDAEARTLIIFDEVQFCPRAREAIKYLVADRRFDYIETGSLISIKKNVKDILIPSEERSVTMYPIDLEEFLWACGEDRLWEVIWKSFTTHTPLPEALHRRASDALRHYFIVGGMPQAVERFLETHDFAQTDLIKRDILNLYRNNIRRYADNQEIKVVATFENLPGELSKHEKKFNLASLQDGAVMRSYEDAFFWLSDVAVVNCYYKRHRTFHRTAFERKPHHAQVLYVRHGTSHQSRLRRVNH